MQIDDYVKELNNLNNIEARYESFGLHVQSIDGHDLDAIDNAINVAKNTKEKTSIIVLNTIKGKGVSFVEEALVDCHSMAINQELLEKALKELN